MIEALGGHLDQLAEEPSSDQGSVAEVVAQIRGEHEHRQLLFSVEEDEPGAWYDWILRLSNGTSLHVHLVDQLDAGGPVFARETFKSAAVELASRIPSCQQILASASSFRVCSLEDDRDTVLILTNEDDHAADAVVHRLTGERIPTLRWDPGSVPAIAAAGASFRDGAWSRLQWRSGAGTRDLARVGVVWVRRPSPPQVNGPPEGLVHCGRATSLTTGLCPSSTLRG